MYLIEYLLLLAGIFFLFYRKEKAAKLILLWILISPIAPALTKDAPHSARQFAIFPSLSIAVGYGIWSLLQYSQTVSLRRIISVFLAIVYCVYIVLFLNRYFILFPHKAYASWGNAYKEMIAKMSSIKDNYEQVIIARPDYSPYIYYLFYKQSDPQAVQTRLKRYPETSEGFAHVQEFDDITYQKIDWAEELLIPHRLYIDWAEGVPTGATNSATLITPIEIAQLRKRGYPIDETPLGGYIISNLVDSVKLPDGTPYFYFIETKIATSAADLPQ